MGGAGEGIWHKGGRLDYLRRVYPRPCRGLQGLHADPVGEMVAMRKPHRNFDYGTVYGDRSRSVGVFVCADAERALVCLCCRDG